MQKGKSKTDVRLLDVPSQIKDNLNQLKQKVNGDKYHKTGKHS